MADRNGPVKAGVAALAFVLFVAIGALAGLLFAGGQGGGAADAFDSRLFGVIRFTLLQAALSTLLAVLPAVPLALAFNRHPVFSGRAMALRLFALPLALPSIVAVLALLALFGAGGPAASLWFSAGLGDWPGIYGLSGILLAHVFYNLPLATRLFLAALAAVPPNHYRLAGQLGMGERAILRIVEGPALRAALPGVAMLVFMMCLTSFTIVLLLGGGPAATTLEVEIYQALRFDFDPARAAALVAVQLTLTGIVALFAGAAGLRGDRAVAVRDRIARRMPAGLVAADAISIGGASVAVIAPLAAIAAAGASADFTRLAGEAEVARATATSLILGTAAALVAVAAAYALAGARKALADRGSRAEALFGRAAMLILVVPGAALGAGWFLAINAFVDPAGFAAPIVVAVNAVMALPFAFNALRHAHDSGRDRHDRLCASLGIAGADRWRLVDWPTLRRPLASAFAFAFALSLGDLGVIALFGSEIVQTLPWLTMARMGAYRTDDAAGLALALGLVALAAMAASERLAGTERS